MFKRILLYTTLFYLVTSPFYEYMPRLFGFSIRTYLLSIILIITLLSAKEHNEIDILLGLFCLLAFGSLFLSKTLISSSAITLINNIILFVIIRHNVQNKKDVYLTLLIYVISILLTGAIALNMASFIENRFTPLHFETNEFGISIGASLIILIWMAWNSNPVRSALLITSALFALFFGYITYSRTMVVAFAGTILYIFRNNRHKWKLAILAGLLIIAMIPFYGSMLIGRISELSSPTGSLNQRTLLLSNTINLIPTYGIFGTGLFQSRPLISATTPLYERYPGNNRISHNMYLTIWLELGILGIALLVSILIVAYKTENNLLKALLIFVMIAALLFDIELHALFWIILALCTVTLKKQTKEAIQ